MDIKIKSLLGILIMYYSTEKFRNNSSIYYYISNINLKDEH